MELPAEKIVFTGDALTVGAPPPMQEVDLEAWQPQYKHAPRRYRRESDREAGTGTTAALGTDGHMADRHGRNEP